MPRVLLINPNTTASITELVADHVRRALGAGYDVAPVTGRFGCAYISSEAAFAVAGHAALDAYAEHGGRCDGVLLACFGDPGLFALREVSPVPVVGLADASFREASTRARRFGVVTGGGRWGPMLERLAADLGYRGALAGVQTVTLTGAQIAANPEAALETLAAACRRSADEDGAEIVIVGGAGLAGLAARLADRVAVPLIDSVEAGARVLATAIAMHSERARPTSTGPDRVQTVGLGDALGQLFDAAR